MTVLNLNCKLCPIICLLLAVNYFSSFKVGSMFSVKEPVPFDLRCALSTSFCVQVVMPVTDIGETSRHLSTRVSEHLSGDRNSRVYQHLQQSQA